MKSGTISVAAHVRRRAKGGKVPQVVAGNKNVLKEAEEGRTGDVDKVSRKKGGKVTPLRMSGGSVKPRADRPARKSGGGVGANASPLSTAHNATNQTAGSSNPTDTYGGTPK